MSEWLYVTLHDGKSASARKDSVSFYIEENELTFIQFVGGFSWSVKETISEIMEQLEE